MLQPARVRRAHHVPLVQRPRRGPFAQTAALRHRLLLPARQVPHRRKLRTELRPHGRILRKVSIPTDEYLSPNFNEHQITSCT